MGTKTLVVLTIGQSEQKEPHRAKAKWQQPMLRSMYFMPLSFSQLRQKAGSLQTFPCQKCSRVNWIDSTNNLQV